MGNRIGALIAILLVVAMVAGTGCASKKNFQTHTEDSDRRVAAVEDAVESNERRIGDLSKETDSKIASVDNKANQAMDTGKKAIADAAAARKAADGKLLWDVTMSDDKVKFEFGHAKLSSDGVAALDALISKAKGYGKALYFEIEGHTDNIGDEMLNTKLGWKRAQAVRDYMNEKGIPLHAMNAVSRGESRPVADNSTKDGRTQNRRVVIRVLE